MRSSRVSWLAAFVLGCIGSGASASTLALEYTVTPVTGGFEYHFTLRVSGDGTFRQGQTFGWLVLGDRSRADLAATIPVRDPLPDFEMTSFPGPWTGLTRSSGSHNGPTLQPVLDGWEPGGVLDELDWYAFSTNEVTGVGDDQLYFSTLFSTGDNPSDAEFELAVRTFPCPADLDDDGNFANGGHPDQAVTIDDLLYFLVGFEAGNDAVDVDDDGADPPNPDGAVTIDDLLFFLIHFENGC